MRKRWSGVSGVALLAVVIGLVGCSAEPSPPAEPVVAAPAPGEAAAGADDTDESRLQEVQGVANVDLPYSSWDLLFKPEGDIARVLGGEGEGISIICAPKAGDDYTTYINIRMSDGRPTGRVKLTFDNSEEGRRWIDLDEEGNFQTACNACSTTFDGLLEDFRTHRIVDVETEDKRTMRLGLLQADEKIPADCRSTRDLANQ